MPGLEECLEDQTRLRENKISKLEDTLVESQKIKKQRAQRLKKYKTQNRVYQDGGTTKKVVPCVQWKYQNNKKGTE